MGASAKSSQTGKFTNRFCLDFAAFLLRLAVFQADKPFPDLDLQVNLRTKATHSCQTDKSHMRRENVTQTWLQKDAACQSKKDSGSSAAMPHVYLAGLTGQREAQLVKVNLSKPPYEE